jgi:hypothetical protein
LQDNSYVRCTPQDRLEPTACTDTAPFTGGGFVGEDFCYEQVVAAYAKVLFGICNG